MIAIAFLFSGAGSQNWTAPKDLKLVGLTCSVGVLVTVDPDAAFADLQAPGANSIRSDILAYSVGNTSTRPPLALQVVKGQVLFVTLPGAGNCILYFS